MKDSRLTKVSFVCYPIHKFVDDSGNNCVGGVDIEECLSIIRDKISSYAYILHDKDIDKSSGEIKKPHYHVVLIFHQATHIKPILKLFNTSVYETVKNINGCIQYLVHKGYDEKYQYSVEEVKSFNLNVEKIINSFTVNNDIESGLIMLFDYVAYCDDIIELIEYAVKNHLYSILKSNYNIIKDYFYHYKKRNFGNKKNVEFKNLINEIAEENN